MDYINLKARAKINIALDVLNKREDGYHNLRMIMQSVNLHDKLFIKKTKDNLIKVSTNLVWLPTDNRNLAYRAADFLKKEFNIKDGIYIEIQKRIPVSAGLAGGSTDCAAVLIGLRNIFNLPITNSELMILGKKFGADVPYCIMRGTALAEGIGDKLTKIDNFPKIYILLAKPNINISTAEVYKNLNLDNIKHDNKIDNIIKSIKYGDIKSISKNMFNVLESVTIKLCPLINDLKAEMINFGALSSLMSGSGPTVFGLYENKNDAVKALKYIKLNYNINECHLTTIFNLY